MRGATKGLFIYKGQAKGGDEMIVLLLLMILIEGVILAGTVKIIALLTPTESSEPKKSNGTDFWLNIISYDHKNERRR